MIVTTPKEIHLNKLPSNPLKPIDYVLYYRTMTDPYEEDVQDEKHRKEFFKKLGKRLIHSKILNDNNTVEWQIISYRTKKPSNDYEYIENFVLLSFPTDVLLKEVEELHFNFPLRKNEANSTQNILPELQEDVSLDKCLLSCCYVKLHKYLIARFKSNQIEMYDDIIVDGQLNENFLSPCVRGYLVHKIVKTLFHEVSIALGTCLPACGFRDAFVLHCETANKNEPVLMRHLKTKYFQTKELKRPKRDPRDAIKNFLIRQCHLTQPLQDIRNYFGEYVAFYFAWCGSFLGFLTVPTVIGFIFTLVHLFYNIFGDSELNKNFDSDTKKRINNSTIKGDYYYNLYNFTFNNFLTPFFGIIISLWGIIFMESWKINVNKLAYEWNVENVKKYELERNDAYLPRKNMWKRILVYIFFVLAILLIIADIILIIIIRVSIKKQVGKNAGLQLLYGDIGSIIINSLFKMITNWIYGVIATKHTNIQHHRTESDYESSLTMKLFVFDFVSNFSPLIYVAFFRQIEFENGFFNLGKEYQDKCEQNDCMTLLSLYILINYGIAALFRLFEFIINFFIKMYFIRWYGKFHSIKTERQFDRKYELLAIDKYELETMDKQEVLKYKIVLANLIFERKKPDFKDDIKNEYLGKVRLYGYLVLFSSSFMLGGLICLILLYIDIRIDAYKFLFHYKRSVGYPDSGIGIWSKILTFINIAAIICNGFTISLISTWSIGRFQSTSYTAKIVFGVSLQLFVLLFWALFVGFVPKEPRTFMLRKLKAQKMVKSKLKKSRSYEPL